MDVGGDIAAGHRLPVPSLPHVKEEGPSDELDEDLALVSQIGGLRVKSARAQAATTKLSAVLAECKERKEQELARRRVARLNRLTALTHWLQPTITAAASRSFAAWWRYTQQVRSSGRELHAQTELDGALAREREVGMRMARRDTELAWLRGRVVAERCARRTHQLCALANNPATPIEFLADAMWAQLGAGLAPAEASVLCYAIWRRHAATTRAERESRAAANAAAAEAAASMAAAAAADSVRKEAALRRSLIVEGIHNGPPALRALHAMAMQVHQGAMRDCWRSWHGAAGASRYARRAQAVAVASMRRASSTAMSRRCFLSWRRRVATDVATLSARTLLNEEALASLARTALSAWRLSALATRCGRYVAQEQQAAAEECLAVQEQLEAQREEGAAARRGLITMEQKMYKIRRRAVTIGTQLLTSQERSRLVAMVHSWHALAGRGAGDRCFLAAAAEVRRRNTNAMKHLASRAVRERVQLVLHTWRQWQVRQHVRRWHDQMNDKLNAQLGEQQEQLRQAMAAIGTTRHALVSSKVREDDRVRMHRTFFAFSQHCFCERAARQAHELEELAAAAAANANAIAAAAMETPRAEPGDAAGANFGAFALEPVRERAACVEFADVAVQTPLEETKQPTGSVRLRCEQYLQVLQARLMSVEARQTALECLHRWRRECELSNLAKLRMYGRERQERATTWVGQRVSKDAGVFFRCYHNWRTATLTTRAELWRKMDRLDARGRREQLAELTRAVHARSVERGALATCWVTWCRMLATMQAERQLRDFEAHCEELNQRLERERDKAEVRAAGRERRASALGRLSRRAEEELPLALRCFSAWRICALLTRVDVYLRQSRLVARGRCEQLSVLMGCVHLRHVDRCLVLLCWLAWTSQITAIHFDRQLKDLELHCDELNEMLEVERHERQKASEQATGRQRSATELEHALQHEADMLRQRHAEMRARSDRLNRELFAVTSTQSSIAGELEDRSSISDLPASDPGSLHFAQHVEADDTSLSHGEDWRHGDAGLNSSFRLADVTPTGSDAAAVSATVSRTSHDKFRRRVSFDLDRAEIIGESDGRAAEPVDVLSPAAESPLSDGTGDVHYPPGELGGSGAQEDPSYQDRLRNFEQMLAGSGSYEEDPYDNQDDESRRHSWSAGDGAPLALLDSLEQEDPVRHEVRALRIDADEFIRHEVRTLSKEPPYGSEVVAAATAAAAGAGCASSSTTPPMATPSVLLPQNQGGTIQPAATPSPAGSDVALPAAPPAVNPTLHKASDYNNNSGLLGGGRWLQRTPLSSEASFEEVDSPLPLPVSLQPAAAAAAAAAAAVAAAAAGMPSPQNALSSSVPQLELPTLGSGSMTPSSPASQSRALALGASAGSSAAIAAAAQFSPQPQQQQQHPPRGDAVTVSASAAGAAAGAAAAKVAAAAAAARAAMVADAAALELGPPVVPGSSPCAKSTPLIALPSSSPMPACMSAPSSLAVSSAAPKVRTFSTGARSASASFAAEPSSGGGCGGEEATGEQAASIGQNGSGALVTLLPPPRASTRRWLNSAGAPLSLQAANAEPCGAPRTESGAAGGQSPTHGGGGGGGMGANHYHGLIGSGGSAVAPVLHTLRQLPLASPESSPATPAPAACAATPPRVTPVPAGSGMGPAAGGAGGTRSRASTSTVASTIYAPGSSTPSSSLQGSVSGTSPPILSADQVAASAPYGGGGCTSIPSTANDTISEALAALRSLTQELRTA